MEKRDFVFFFFFFFLRLPDETAGRAFVESSRKGRPPVLGVAKAPRITARAFKVVAGRSRTIHRPVGTVFTSRENTWITEVDVAMLGRQGRCSQETPCRKTAAAQARNSRGRF